MKKYFFLILTFFYFSFPSFAQKKLYLPDNSFRFELARFAMPLFKKEEIIGVIKDFFLVRTSIGNSLTLLLVDKEGNIIENFEGNWLLPENWQEENSFWLYQPSQSFSDPTPTMVNILKYNFSTRKREIKSVEIPEYYQYSEFKPTIIGHYFSCLNIQREIFLFEFATGKLTKISTRNHQIISFNLDTTTKKVNIFEMVNGSQDVTVKFYQLPIADEIDFNKYLKWAKKAKI